MSGILYKCIKAGAETPNATHVTDEYAGSLVKLLSYCTGHQYWDRWQSLAYCA